MEDQREVSVEKIEAFKREKNIEFSFETSARTGENIEELFIIASKLLYNNFKDKIAAMVSPIHFHFLLLTQLFCSLERRSHEKEKNKKTEKISRKRCKRISC
jgi:hypothetical protein